MAPHTHKPAAAALPATDITFSDVSVHVTDRRTGEKKTIIHNASGAARSGRLLAMMGASGAGKSTLLDVLSSQMSQSMEVEGQILVNGQRRSKAALQRVSCYVQQRDVLLCSATVREAITTSALLKLPASMTRADKEARVDAVLKELDLEGCADTLIGDETIGLKGISGGQKRRVSVGIELVKDPAVIFLDEPTSGLDSEMALSCMEALCRLAHNGRTVVCTIHQPNSDITALFDDFMLLAAGHVVFFGPWAGAVDFFAQVGFPCPNYRNPTDYFLSVVRDSKAAEQLWTAHRQHTASGPHLAALPPCDTTSTAAEGDVESQAAGGATAAVARAGTSGLADGAGKGGLGQGGGSSSLELVGTTSERVAGGAGQAPAQAPIWQQASVLVSRKVKDWFRNPTMLTSELAQYLFIGLFVGAMYFNSFEDNTTEGVTNRSACIWFALAVMCFTPSYTTVTNWDKERLLLKREVSQRMYALQTYYTARSVVMIPFQAAQCLMFVAIMYFFAGFQANAAKFFIFFLTLLLFQLVSEGIGMLCALATKTATASIVLLTFILLLMLSFSGFLVTTIPVYFRWLNKTSYLTYAYAALVGNEFEGLTLTAPNGEQVPGMSAVPSAILTQFGVWGNIGILAAQAAGMELLKLGALHLAYRLNMF